MSAPASHRTAAAALAAALAVAVAGGCGRSPREEVGLRGELRLAELLGGEAAGFRRAEAPRPFVFPADHGPHDGFRTEWWYVTGNLRADDGREFGYQLTFFRQAVAAQAPAGGSRWRPRHLWMAHFAVTDVAGGRFHAHERFAREALGLAAAEASPPAVRVDAWELAAVDRDASRFRLAARAGEVALALDLVPTRPPVAQGVGGLSAKGPEPGNASHYYSLPRLATTGVLELAGERYAVSGASWLDREWSTSALPPGVVGWDWLALHLDDGGDLMLYRLRRADGGTASESAGSLALADGSVRPFAAGDFTLAPLATWESPRGGRYPARWRLAVAPLALELEIEPLLAAQELPLAVRYWEGAVRAAGRRAGRPVAGRGYVELTGYADPPPAGAR